MQHCVPFVVASATMATNPLKAGSPTKLFCIFSLCTSSDFGADRRDRGTPSYKNRVRGDIALSTAAIRPVSFYVLIYYCPRYHVPFGSILASLERSDRTGQIHFQANRTRAITYTIIMHHQNLLICTLPNVYNFFLCSAQEKVA